LNLYLHQRTPESFSFYIDGNLQFDSADEAIYHESLALPVLCLATQPKRVLICGGGDGLALREVLRFPGIQEVVLIDCSNDVLDLGRNQFAELNDQSLSDSRVTIVVADALNYALPTAYFDTIICDFTFPTTLESAEGFSVEWYEKLAQALSSGGKMAINAVSPQNTFDAFACLVSTIRAANLQTLPFRVCIPSFRDQGYGAWGFILASKERLTIRQLQNLSCPISTQQVELSALARGAHFTAAQRYQFHVAPVNRAGDMILQRLLVNPEASNKSLNFDTPPEFPNLLQQIEVSHPYHSRSMIETLAEHVAGSLQSIDLKKLVSELLKRAQSLPRRILDELEVLREYLSRTVLDLEIWGKWATRLFATLLIVMTIANSISPDPAFAKGHSGLGHSSFSRGFSSHETFGGGLPTGPRAPMSGNGFRSNYGTGPVDVYGYHYSPRIYIYNNDWYGSSYGYSSGSNRGGGGHQPHQQLQHKPLFVLDDDLLAMDNGDFVVTLSDKAFLLVSNGKVTLMDSTTGAVIQPIYAEPKLFDQIRQEVNNQSGDLDTEIRHRRDWLSWTGWTADLIPTVRADNLEYLNLQDLKRRLGVAGKKLGESSDHGSLEVPNGGIELFVGCHILADNRVQIYSPGGKYQTTDGITITGSDGKTSKISPQFKTVIVSVIKKMVTETQQDMDSDRKDLQSLQQEATATQMDLSEYQNLQMQNSYDPDYEVDYGTDSIPVGQAIQKTSQDLAEIQREIQTLQLSIQTSEQHLARFQTALHSWSE